MPRPEYVEALLPNDFPDDGTRLPLKFCRPRVPQNGYILRREAELQQPPIVDFSEPFAQTLSCGIVPGTHEPAH